MKKIILVSLWISLVLSWCSSQEKITKKTTQTQEVKQTCTKFFTVWNWQNQVYNLQAKVVSSNIKNITSSNAGLVSYLNCTPWKYVKSKTLIAKITPDWSDSNIKNLINQKKSVQTQLNNTRNILVSTKSNFSSQLNSLVTQKSNLENQIKILNQNLTKLTNQKKYWVNDLWEQLSSLQTQLKNLKKSKSKLEQSKNADIEKIKLAILNTKDGISSSIKNDLFRIDEIFWISNENKHKNDAYENYLSAKDTTLKNKVKNNWRKISSQKMNNLSNEEFSNYIQQVDLLVQDVKQAIKNSVSSRTFPQTQINTYYNEFNSYDLWLIASKTKLDDLIQNYTTIVNNYDTQIISLQTQIDTIKSNIKNIKNNKINSYSSSIDIQINTTKTQIDNINSSLQNIKNQIKSLADQENIQLKQLENQISSLKSNLSQININLAPQNIYAGVNGKIKIKKVDKWNKVWPNSLICQIVPNKSSLKLQIYGDLGVGKNLGEVEFKDNNWKNCKLKIVSKLPYQDPVTQNNIYETENNIDCNIQEWEILSVKYYKKESKVINWNKKIIIPLNFVINRLTGQEVIKFIKTWDYQKIKVKLWNIDGTNVWILSWLKIWDRVCR